MTYIVHGATGAQGSPVLSALVAANKTATGITRHPDTVLEGASALVADYSSVAQLSDAYRGAEGVFVHLPLGPEELLLPFAHNVAAAVAEGQPAHVVVSTSGKIVDDPTHPLQQPADNALPILLEALKATGSPVSVIAPRLFLENLLLPPVLDAVRTEGVLRYPLRADFPVSWASHLDIADVAATLLTHPEVTGVVGVGQLPGITGPDLAAAFAEHLGRDVHYEAITPEQFGELIVPLFGEAATAGVVALYQAQWGLADNVIQEETSAQSLLGITPRTVGRWLADIGV